MENAKKDAGRSRGEREVSGDGPGDSHLGGEGSDLMRTYVKSLLDYKAHVMLWEQKGPAVRQNPRREKENKTGFEATAFGR